MFFKLNRKFRLIDVDNSFANLISIDTNEDLHFEMRYMVKQSEVVHRNALMVIVTISSQHLTSRPLFENSHDGTINSRALVQNILKQVQNIKSTSAKRKQFDVASQKSDILSSINNENITQLKAKIPNYLIQSMNNTRLQSIQNIENKQNNEDGPLLQITAHNSIENKSEILSDSVELPTQRVIYDMILKQGFDPSNVINLTHRSLSANSVFGGLLRRSKGLERSFDPSVKLLHYYLFLNNKTPFKSLLSDVDEQRSVHVAKNIVQDAIEIPVNICLPKKMRKLEGKDVSHFFVKFELFDSKTKSVIDTVIKSLDITRHQQLYYTPTTPPIVKASPSPLGGFVNLEIKQRDPGANGVRIFKKNLSRATTTIDDYVLIGTYDLQNYNSLKVRVDLPLDNPAIYRVISFGELGSMSSEYTNVVVRPSHYKSHKAIALNAQNVEQGIQIEVRKIPINCVAIEILTRNRSTFENNWTNVNGITFIDDATRTADHFSIIHDEASNNRKYEYTSRLIFRDGTSELVGQILLERLRSEPGKVDTEILNLTIDHNDQGPNVSFTINSNIIDNDIDLIRNLLSKQEMKEYFNNDIRQNRESMQGLLAHNVQRVNLTTGQREDFGVLRKSDFNDQESRKIQSVEQLQYGHNYRYEITPLLRAAETLFENIKITRVDEVTGKSYTFNPSKFLHPISLRDGTLVTKNGLKTRYSKSPLAHGALGTIKTVDVTFSSLPARIIEQNATQFSKNLNIVTWKIEGNIKQIDHFLIMKDVHSVRTIVGKVHSEFEFGNGQYFHQINLQDQGELAYIIVPIFNDYQIGKEEMTNSIVVK